MKKIFIIISFLFLVGCSSAKQEEHEFKLYEVKKKDLSKVIEINGSVEIENEIQVVAPLNGRLEKLYIEEGQVIRKGQKIGYMSSNERIRMLDMAAHKGPKEVAYWKKQLLPTYIFAPASGKIIDIKSKAGDTVRGPFAKISQGLIFRGNLDEVDVPKVSKNQEVDVTFDIDPDKKYTGSISKISQISTVVSNVNVYPIEVQIKDSQSLENIKIGMSVVVTIPVESVNQALYVPAVAVNNLSNDTVAVTLESGTKKNVVLGSVYGSNVHIKEGLNLGDKVRVKKFKQGKKSQKKNLFKMLGK